MGSGLAIMLWPNPVRQPDLVAIRQWLPPKFSGASVIEVACGTGYWTQLISSFAVNVLAIDAATETLAIAGSAFLMRTFPAYINFIKSLC